MKIRSILGATATLVLAAIATAQPVPNADLGTLTNPATVTGTLTGYVANQVQWIKFTLPAGATLAGTGYLDIDTQPGTLSSADSHIGLYKADGTFLDSDDDDGPGFYSSLTYGRTTPTRAAVGTGTVHNGRDGAADITAGTYYLAVTAYGSGTNTYGPNFAVGVTHSATGDIGFRIDYVGDLASVPPACSGVTTSPVQGPIGTSFTATTVVTPGTGPVSTGITVSLNATAVNGGTVVLHDDGIAPDTVAGDGTYSGTVTVGAGAAFGAQTLTSTVSDAQNRTSTCTGTFTVIPPPPANDDCSGALVASVGTNSFDTTSATRSSETACAGSGTDVWFKYTSPAGGQVTVATCGGTSADTVLALYSACGGAYLGCSDDFCSTQSSVTVCATAGQTLFIRIGDYFTNTVASGTFTIADSGGGSGATLAASATPTCGSTGTAVTITTNLSGVGCPAQTITSASADASIIDGGTVTLHDDGVAPDTTAGDGIWSGSTSYGAGAAPGNIVVTANLSGGGTATANIAVTTGSGSDEAGDTLATAAVLTGGSITSISGQLNSTPGCTITGNDADMFKFQMCDPANFSASTVGGTTLDTQLFLFNAQGFGVAFSDDANVIAGQSTITNTFTASLPVANYYLAISSYDKDPLDSAGNEIWLDQPFATERAPDGPGAANAVDHWSTGGTGGSYTITLTGACGAAPECHGTCVADFDDGTGTGTPDGGVTIDDLLYYLGLFEAGTICADVDDGTGTGTPDGGVTIDDLLYFLGRFEAGC